jgi:Xaa-Pro aminopeptidase
MQSHFTSDFFAANRARLRELFQGTAPIVIAANGLLQRGGDSSFNFEQDANFWYLTGIDEPDLLLVLDRDKQYLIVPERSDSRQAFDGTIDADELTRRSGIQDVYAEKAGWDQLVNRLGKVKHVATVAPAPAYIEQYGLYTNPARATLLLRLKTYNEMLEVLDLSTHLARMRMVKQPPELAAIQQAIDITLATIKQIAKPAQIIKYAHEYEIEADISRGFRRRGAEGHSFAPIVASGGRAVTLHNVANNGPLSADDLLIMDIGAEVEHYAADITRTISLSTPSRRQKAVHAAVYDVQQYAMGLLKPGILLHDYEEQVEHYMGEKLRELGLIKSISHEAVRTYYPHATSHYLGLNVHDAGEYERPLEPGVVITVEPGIYIPEENIGIRIEDDVLITETGVTVLSRKLPGSLS